MPIELIVGLVGILGVVVGAAANAISGHALTKRKFLQDSRYEAYILFLRSLALMGATPPGSAERWSGVSGLIEAKSRIALFGSQPVVTSLSEYSRKHPRVDENNFEELARVIALMRADVGAKKVFDLERHLRGLLFEVGTNQ